MRQVLHGGSVDPAFGAVQDLFLETVASHPGTGASLAVWHDGVWVVDLHAGWSDAERRRPWAADTLVMPYSVTKPFAALCALVLVDRGVLDLDEPLATYWPELTAPTTLRQVLAHRSGLVLLDVDAPEEAFYDWALMCRLLERQPPAWQPGAEHGESALLYGHLVGEVVRRVDGRTLGTFLREEICGPRGLDFHVGLAEGDLDRVADLTGYAPGYLHTVMEGGPLRRRAISNPPGVLDPAVVNAARWRRSEVPAVNGHGTARSVAGLYVALQRGRVLTADLLADATRPQGTGPDRVMGGDRSWGLGVDVDDDGYGMGGLGGSFGWWSERGQYAFAFMSGHIGDPDRGDRLESAVRAVLGLPPV